MDACRFVLHDRDDLPTLSDSEFEEMVNRVKFLVAVDVQLRDGRDETEIADQIREKMGRLPGDLLLDMVFATVEAIRDYDEETDLPTVTH